MRNKAAKSVLTVALALVMLLGVLPLTALAADDGYGYTTEPRDRYYRYYDDYYYYRYYDADSDHYRYDYYYDRYVNSYNLYGRYWSYGGYYDDDLYRGSRDYLNNNKVEVENATGQVYKGAGTVSFTIPSKSATGLTDVIVYPKGNRNKEMILEKGTEYKVEKGRLTITLTESFLNTLKNGKYEVIIYFVTNQGYGSFEVKY